MRRLIIVFILIFWSFSLQPAYSYWVWTPKTNKWTNPKNQPKPTPKEQLDFSKSLYDAENYEEAKKEFKKTLKYYPKSIEAAESQYYLGLTEEAQGNLYEAYQAYQKVIDKYPFSERIPQIIEREYNIGDAFLSGAKRKVLGLDMPVDNPAIEIFSKIVENSTYGPLAPAAQYKLGLVLKQLLRYYEAEEAFNKVITNYPDSDWASAAKFQIASCRAAESRGPDYDQGAAAEAKSKFEQFVREHPEAALSKEAEKNLEVLNEKETAANYNIARFYEKQKAYTGARTYYEDIIAKFPDSPWAKKSKERLEIIENMEKKK